MHTVPYRRWSPARSPVAVEFAPELPSRLAASPASAGLLYGMRHEQEFRILAWIPQGEAGNAPSGGLRLLGTYAVRARGEIFLTESDLEEFARQNAEIALVICGGRGGIFVRERDGSVQGIRSYEEFPVIEPPVPRPRSRPAPVNKAESGLKWGITAALILGLLPLAALAFLPASQPGALDLQLRERQGQLIVSWNPYADTDGGQIEISDGRDRYVTTLHHGQSSATWVIRSGDITATLRSSSQRGPVRKQTVRLKAHPVHNSEPPIRDPGDLEALVSQAAELQQRFQTNQARIVRLSREISRLVKNPPATQAQ